MSGRSAYVRAKNNEKVDRRPSRQVSQYAPDDPYVYGYGDLPQPLARPGFSTAGSFTSPPHIRRRSHSSLGSAHSYPSAPHLHKPRPIVIASAIEKSDFRTHLDGMSSTLRGKLGGLIKTGKKEPEKERLRRPGTAMVDSEYDYEPRSPQPTTPSIGAVPSLSHSETPSEAAPSSQPANLFTIPTRQKQSQESVIHKIRRFEGGGKLPQLGWKSLSNNPELWDECGDTYVYMYMTGSRTKPPPSFRIDSKVILQSGSKTFIDQLRKVSEPEGWPKFYPSKPSSRHDSPVFRSDSRDSFRSPSVRSTMRSDDSDSDAIRPVARSGAGSPRITRTAAINHEIYVPWPGAEINIHSTIWHITTRNFFAVMYDASALVGTTLHEALTKLFERVVTNPNYLGKDIDQVAWITDYIVRHRFDDVTNNPSYAASLLAFSEMPNVQWREGYIEAFVHCVGMLDLGLRTIPEWRHITPHTKMFLSNAHMEIEERISRAQNWLQSFDFHEMWPTTTAGPTVARGCYDRLRKWLRKYYENAYLHWPPSNDISWLTRDMVLRLEADFHSLYDYLVDRDIIFDDAESRPGHKWTMTSQSGNTFRADTFELPMTDIFIGFDERNGFPHIPHPYPLTPPSVSTAQSRKSAFTLKKSSTPAAVLALSRRKALSYAEASNVYTLRDQYMHTDLVTDFIRFEQQDEIETQDPFEARRGRWILVYGILQVLATISVDSPNLRFKDGAQYHLCPQMKGVVPWAERGSVPEEEADHRLSHCWVVPRTWGPVVSQARPDAYQSLVWGQADQGVKYSTDGPNLAGLTDSKSLALGADADLSVKATANANNANGRDTSIGRKRAEEWLNNNDAGEPGSDDGMTIERTESFPRNHGVSVKSETETVESTGNGEEHESGGEKIRAEAKRRRKVVQGFSDYKPPKEW